MSISDERIMAVIDGRMGSFAHERHRMILALCHQIARESAEAMRERCAKLCDDWPCDMINRHELSDPGLEQERILSIVADAIRKLPIEGESK